MAPRPPSARPPSSDVPSARTAAAERASYRQVLGHGEFRAIFAADVVSMLGNVVAAVALTVLVYQRTHSPALAASVMTLAFLPYLFGGILLGAAADRLPARGVLVGCDLISASLVGVMVIPGIPVAGMLALLFVAGLVSPVYSGARSALLPDVLTPGPRYVLGCSAGWCPHVRSRPRHLPPPTSPLSACRPGPLASFLWGVRAGPRGPAGVAA